MGQILGDDYCYRTHLVNENIKMIKTDSAQKFIGVLNKQKNKQKDKQKKTNKKQTKRQTKRPKQTKSNKCYVVRLRTSTIVQNSLQPIPSSYVASCSCLFVYTILLLCVQSRAHDDIILS